MDERDIDLEPLIESVTAVISHGSQPEQVLIRATSSSALIGCFEEFLNSTVDFFELGIEKAVAIQINTGGQTRFYFKEPIIVRCKQGEFEVEAENGIIVEANWGGNALIQGMPTTVMKFQFMGEVTSKRKSKSKRADFQITAK